MTDTAALINKLSQYTNFDEQEHEMLRSLLSEPITVRSNTELLQEGERGSMMFIVIEGWAYCYKDLPDGSRQVVNFQLAGDLLGLRSVLLRTSDHSFATLTECRLVGVKKDGWEDLFGSHPRIGLAVLWAAAREEAMVVEHLVNLGRRTADHRTAHLLCELGHRLQTRGLRGGKGFDCPMSQVLLADALGLSVVHLNRTLRKLREAGFIDTRDRMLHVIDFDGLAEFAEFDGDYLGN